MSKICFGAGSTDYYVEDKSHERWATGITATETAATCTETARTTVAGGRLIPSCWEKSLFNICWWKNNLPSLKCLAAKMCLHLNQHTRLTFDRDCMQTPWFTLHTDVAVNTIPHIFHVIINLSNVTGTASLTHIWPLTEHFQNIPGSIFGWTYSM